MFRGLRVDFERTRFSHLGLLGDWLEKEKTKGMQVLKQLDIGWPFLKKRQM
jgi:hypothetical protein